MKTKWFVIKKFMKLTLRETAVYATISCYSDNKNISHISRDTLAFLTGLNDLDTLSRYTANLEKKGLIRKTYNHYKGKRLVEYEIIKPDTDYLYITNKLFSENTELIGFLIKLAEHRYYNTNQIYLSDKELAEKMDISRPTFKKYMKIALQSGSVIKTDDGYSLSEEVFPLFKREWNSKPTAKQKKKIDEILNRTEELEDVEDSPIRVKKILLSYYDPKTNTFSGLKGSVDDFLDFCLSGVPKKSKNPVEQPQIEYKF